MASEEQHRQAQARHEARQEAEIELRTGDVHSAIAFRDSCERHNAALLDVVRRNAAAQEAIAAALARIAACLELKP